MEAGAENIKLITDSQLIATQMEGTAEARDPTITQYRDELWQLTIQLAFFEIQLVPRAENKEADGLSKLASSNLSDLGGNIMVEVRTHRVVDNKVVATNNGESEWFAEVLLFKEKGILPEDKVTAARIRK